MYEKDAARTKTLSLPGGFKVQIYREITVVTAHLGSPKDEATHAGDRLRVGLIVDWYACQRTWNYWNHILTRISDEGTVRIGLSVFRPGDDHFESVSRVEAGDPEFLEVSPRIRSNHELHQCQVLIINWDAMNGDPDFGSDINLRWLRHRRPELLEWVAQGNILIVEGQATLSVPSQRSYDAVLGEGELRVCGSKNQSYTANQASRSGGQWKLTKTAGESPRLGNVFVAASPKREYRDMFPPCASRFLALFGTDLSWAMVYRGWFSRQSRVLRKPRWDWVDIAVTDRPDKSLLRPNHAILKAAKHGSGIIFVSTMLLAGGNQVHLIKALLGFQNRAPELPTANTRRIRIRDSVLLGLAPLVILLLIETYYGGNYEASYLIRAIALVASVWGMNHVNDWMKDFKPRQIVDDFLGR